MENPIESARLLESFYHMRKRDLPSFSGRRLAQKLGLSPSYLTELFKGRKSIPMNRITEICDALGLESAEREKLLVQIIYEKTGVKAELKIKPENQI